MDLQQQISAALGRAMVDAIPETPSGGHKTLVVGQIVVNVTPDAPCKKGVGADCCCGRDRD